MLKVGYIYGVGGIVFNIKVEHLCIQCQHSHQCCIVIALSVLGWCEKKQVIQFANKNIFGQTDIWEKIQLKREKTKNIHVGRKQSALQCLIKKKKYTHIVSKP